MSWFPHHQTHLHLHQSLAAIQTMGERARGVQGTRSRKEEERVKKTKIKLFIIQTRFQRENKRIPRLFLEMYHFLTALHQNRFATLRTPTAPLLRLVERLLRAIHHDAGELHAGRLHFTHTRYSTFTHKSSSALWYFRTKMYTSLPLLGFIAIPVLLCHNQIVRSFPLVTQIHHDIRRRRHCLSVASRKLLSAEADFHTLTQPVRDLTDLHRAALPQDSRRCILDRKSVGGKSGRQSRVWSRSSSGVER